MSTAIHCWLTTCIISLLLLCDYRGRGTVPHARHACVMCGVPCMPEDTADDVLTGIL